MHVLTAASFCHPDCLYANAVMKKCQPHWHYCNSQAMLGCMKLDMPSQAKAAALPAGWLPACLPHQDGTCWLQMTLPWRAD
jgi:hypothetical protein